jgi:hypothetical protein
MMEGRRTRSLDAELRKKGREEMRLLRTILGIGEFSAVAISGDGRKVPHARASLLLRRPPEHTPVRKQQVLRAHNQAGELLSAG